MLDILVVDDEPAIRAVVGGSLRAAGHRVTLASDAAEATSALDAGIFDLVISDVRLPKGDGMGVFRKTKAVSPTTDVILITGFGEVVDAVEALKQGARDYLTKPFETDELVIRVARIADQRALANELASARRELSAHGSSPGLVGRSPAMVRLTERVSAMAESDAPVLITGESGTGKEVVARRIHEQSARAAKPFVAVNCAAFPESLIEAELFGHERGAFTGAVRRRDGRFQAADGGILFLDEIAEIPLPVQAKLLRVLQEGVVEPLGTDTPVHVDVRILSATHRDLKERIRGNLFREDLYYRLNVLDLAIPPLRERGGDLPLLVEHFLSRFVPAGQPRPSLSPGAWAALSEYRFPGNVRELEHAIERAVVLSRGKEIAVEHLPRDVVGGDSGGNARGGNGDVRTLSSAAKEFEREYLARALEHAGGRKTRAAELLGISRKNLWEKLRAHGLTD